MATQKSTLLSSFDFFAPPILLENVQVNFNATFSPYIEEKWWRHENQICELMGLVGISRKHKMEHIASLKVILFMLIRVIKQINKKSFSNSLLFFISFTLIFLTDRNQCHYRWNLPKWEDRISGEWLEVLFVVKRWSMFLSN